MKKIKINEKLFALVDDEDFERVSQYNWTLVGASGNKSVIKYLVTNINYKTVPMHRFLLNVTDSKIIVDHKDGNGLNNQRSNLRVCTHAQNCSNRTRTHKLNTSGYRGVYKIYKNRKWTGKWKAKIGTQYLGSYDSPELAALAYDKAALQLKGEYAGRLNYHKILNKLTRNL